MTEIICNPTVPKNGIIELFPRMKSQVVFNCNDDGNGGCGCILHSGEYTCNNDGNGGCACVTAGY